MKKKSFFTTIVILIVFAEMLKKKPGHLNVGNKKIRQPEAQMLETKKN